MIVAAFAFVWFLRRLYGLLLPLIWIVTVSALFLRPGVRRAA